MPWLNIRATNSGGGRRPSEASAKLYESGQLTLSHTTCQMLGYPERVLVSVEPDLQAIRLTPTTPTHTGAFSLSGGGNSPHRIGLKVVAGKYPQLLGSYIAHKIAGGIELRKAED